MEGIIDAQHGPIVLLGTIAVFMCLHLVLGTGRFLFELFRKKAESSEQKVSEISMALRQNTEAVRELRVQISVFEQELRALKSLKVDTEQMTSAIKFLAGKRWPSIRKAIEADKLPG